MKSQESQIAECISSIVGGLILSQDEVFLPIVPLDAQVPFYFRMYDQQFCVSQWFRGFSFDHSINNPLKKVEVMLCLVATMTTTKRYRKVGGPKVNKIFPEKKTGGFNVKFVINKAQNLDFKKLSKVVKKCKSGMTKELQKLISDLNTAFPEITFSFRSLQGTKNLRLK